VHCSHYSGDPFRYIRIKEGGTYNGAMLQVYIDKSDNQVQAFIVGDNFQSSGWSISDWIPDGTDPGGGVDFSSLTNVAAQINIDEVQDGGISTTGPIYAGSDTTQYKVWHAGNDGSGSGLDADLLDGLNSSQFLRSDTSDTINGSLTVTGTLEVLGNRIGFINNSFDAEIRVSDSNPNGTGAVFDFYGDGVSRNATLSAEYFDGTAVKAQYADLAENYLADYQYLVGTVLDIGGSAEVTVATKDSYRIAGTVSEKPGYLMNSELKGEHVTPVAYIGRVPCRVIGKIHRGDILVVGDTPGVAVACHPKDILPGQAVGKALESYNNDQEGVIEIMVGRL
jgi:hypothetical protein